MKVSEVMTRRSNRPPRPVSAGSSQLHAERDAGSIPVTDGDRLIGMITDRDIAVRGVAKGHGPDTPVRDLMTDEIIVVSADDDVEEAAQKMSRPRSAVCRSSTTISGSAASSASAT